MRVTGFGGRFGMAALAIALAAGCGGTPEDVDDGVEPTIDGNLYENEADEPPEPGKQDAVLGARAVPLSADDSDTAAWKPTRKWADKVNVDFSPYFTKNENLTWNQAYRKFFDGLQETQSTSGWRTYKVTTPWGKTLPIASLECSEQMMTMRATFAAWFKLPFFMEAVDSKRVRMFAGHFGFRTTTGKYGNFPAFKTKFKDHSATATLANWPKDATLRTKKLGSDDDQSGVMGVPGAGFGAYLDELHANKRAAWVIFYMQNWFGSANLADAANTFQVKPAGILPGDILLERWQRAGIGHALNVKKVTPVGDQFEVEVASGSMPRRQSYWENAITSRHYFLLEYTGGEGTASDGTPYAKLGGGLRGWRVTATYNGGYINIVPQERSANWINSTDYAAIAARPAQFETLLAVPDPQVRKTALLEALAQKRANQRQKPASCSNREARDGIIRELESLRYDVGWSTTEFAEAVYSWEDFVFPALEYPKSKTCCWNSTTPAMADIVIKYNQDRDRRSSQCLPPVPFRNDNGYTVFKTYAASIGRAADWKEWTEDEPCPQKTVATDTIMATAYSAPGEYCDVESLLQDNP